MATTTLTPKTHRPGAVKYALTAFVVTLVAQTAVLDKLDESKRNLEGAKQETIATIYANSVETVLTRALSATVSLSIMVHQGKGSVSDFQELSKYLLPLYKGAYALSLAPGGIIRQIEPAAPNLLAQDHDLLGTEDKKKAIPQLDENAVQFYGPFELLQGPVGAIGMLPVYLRDEHDKKYFWGLTVVTLALPDALADAGLAHIEQQGYSFELSGMDPETGLMRIIAASSSPLQGPVIHKALHISNTTWTLKVSPAASLAKERGLYFDWTLMLFISALFGWLALAITQLSASKEALARIAHFDPLTGLPNRRLLLSLIEDALKTPEEHGHPIAICYMDLDGFKLVNDVHGHAMGDQLLREVAARITECLRSADTLARIGGDEFVLILTGLKSLDECQAIIDRVVERVAVPYQLESGMAFVSASIGTALYGVDGLLPDELLRKADHAMYEAKKNGKNHNVFARRTREPS